MNQSQFSNRYKRKQAGFTMIEITLALAISAFVAYALFKSRITESVQQSAQVQADQVLQLREALQSYANTNGKAIVEGTAVTGVANALQPTAAELLNLQLLPTQFKTSATLNNSPFVMQLTVAPTGCALGACVVSGHVYVRDPFLARGDDATKGQYDGVSISTMLSRMGGDAFARVVPNGSLVASGGNFSITNSAAVAHPTIKVNTQPYPAGVVGIRIASVTPPAPVATGTGTGTGSGTGTGTEEAAGFCENGTIDGVGATGTNGKGSGNQCTFNYPAVEVGTSDTVSSSKTSTIGALTVRCIAVAGKATIDIVSMTCIKK